MKVRAEIDFDILNAFCLDDFDGNKYLIGCGFINDTHIYLDNGDKYPIKKDTRAVHFEDDMFDCDNNPMFASLQSNGKGGDLVNYSVYPTKYTMIYSSKNGVKAICLDNPDNTGYILNPRLKLIGIQE